MKKQELIDIAKDTLEISRQKRYYKHNKTIFLQPNSSKLYEDVKVSSDKVDKQKGVIEFRNESVVASILHTKDEKVAVLNFASAKHPGGGFQTGAKAQEESIARSSNLYETLIPFQKEFYDYHVKQNSPLYSDKMIYSENIAVMKNDEGYLLNNPTYVDIITSPAVNAGHAREKHISEEVIRKTMQNRIRKVIHLAKQNNVNTLILGAWGCGVFKNKEKDIAEMFNQVLEKEGMKYCFNKIIFSIYDTSERFNLFKGFYYDA